MQSFFDSKICKSRKRCWQCRANPKYRAGIAAEYDVPDVDFSCPFGITKESIPETSRGASLVDKARGITETIVESIALGVNGEPIIVEKSDAEKRMDICRACEYLRQNETCSLCDCVMSFKTKLGAGHCPASKW